MRKRIIIGALAILGIGALSAIMLTYQKKVVCFVRNVDKDMHKSIFYGVMGKSED